MKKTQTITFCAYKYFDSEPVPSVCSRLKCILMYCNSCKTLTFNQSFSLFLNFDYVKKNWWKIIFERRKLERKPWMKLKKLLDNKSSYIHQCYSSRSILNIKLKRISRLLFASMAPRSCFITQYICCSPITLLASFCR